MNLHGHFIQQAHESMKEFVNNLNPDSETEYEAWSEKFSNSEEQWWNFELHLLDYKNFNELLETNTQLEEEYGRGAAPTNVRQLLQFYGLYLTRYCYDTDFKDYWKNLVSPP